MTGWTRAVTLQWVTPGTLAPSASDTGLRQVTVTITLNGKTMLARTGLKARRWESIWP